MNPADNNHRMSSILSEVPEDDIYWNQNSDKNSHSKCDCKVDIAEVFKVQKTFIHTETIVQTAVTTSK